MNYAGARRGALNRTIIDRIERKNEFKEIIHAQQ